MIIHYNCTIGSFWLHSFLLIYMYNWCTLAFDSETIDADMTCVGGPCIFPPTKWTKSQKYRLARLRARAEERNDPLPAMFGFPTIGPIKKPMAMSNFLI